MQISELIDSGLSLIPVGEDKRPLGKWKQYQETINHSKNLLEHKGNIALICGKVSGNIEVIDVDLKYDKTGRLFKQYKRLIHDQDELLLGKLTVQKTVNNGFHLIYKCQEISGNQKLASSLDDDVVEVLIETRGEGGYILIEPSKGYEKIYGSFTNIQTISPEERSILLDTARSFDELPKEHKQPVIQDDITPLNDYAIRGDVLQLLQNKGWTVVKDNGDKVFLKRPGETKSKWSADYTRSKNVFYVWTTSSVFPEQAGYSPGAVYAYLEHNGDFSAAAKELLSQGYGSKTNTDKYEDSPRVRVSKEDNDYSFLLPKDAGIKKVYDIVDGKVIMGLKFGIPQLDNHLRFKYNQYLLIVANTNIGKTTVVLFLLVRLIKENPTLKFLCLVTENTVDNTKRILIQFYLKKIVEKDIVTKEMIREANEWIHEHFRFIDPFKGYNYQELLIIGEKVMSIWEYSAMFVDPYNSLKVEMRLMPGATTYDYHVEASRSFQAFSNTTTGIILNCHTITSQQRLGGSSRPLLSHVEGGGSFVNKCHDGVVFHRDIKNPDSFRISEIHVDKIKDTMSGGKWTFSDDPVRLYLMHDQSRFVEADSKDAKQDQELYRQSKIKPQEEEDPEFVPF